MCLYIYMYIVYIDSMEWQLFAIQGLLCQSRHIRDIHSEDVTASQPGSLLKSHLHTQDVTILLLLFLAAGA